MGSAHQGLGTWVREHTHSGLVKAGLHFTAEGGQSITQDLEGDSRYVCVSVCVRLLIDPRQP